MATRGTNERALDAFYAGLTPLERSRLLARLFRDQDWRGLERLRATIPDAEAGAAYNRALRILRQLHGTTAPMLLAIGLGIEHDTWVLLAASQMAGHRLRAQTTLRRLWRVVGYPVTAAEYRALAEMERSEPWRLDDYAAWLADFRGTEEGLNPAVRDLLLDLPPIQHREYREEREGDGRETDEATMREDAQRAAAIAKQIHHRIDAAVNRGELPQPRRSKQGASLPRGVLVDWGEGTSLATFTLLPPAYHVPALDVLGGELAAWEVHPDGGADAVAARRAGLQQLGIEILAGIGDPEIADLRGLKLDPPATAEERERMAEEACQHWPWGHGGDRDRLGDIGRMHARRRAELRAYAATIATLRETEFGGEDPLDPLLRGLLEGAEASEQGFAELWAVATDLMAPELGAEAGTWPPALEDDEYLEELHRDVEKHLRGEWDS